MNSIPFNNQYVKLGAAFYVRTRPVRVARPVLIKYNDELGRALGLPVTTAEERAAIFSGSVMPAGAEPLAMVYAGHQFGQFNPQLGDGRAILLGELDHPAGGSVSVQLKGSGQTAYSRMGDGRAALGPVLREYLVSEAMHQLGVPTTRALAVVATGEEVARERLLPGGVITRVARSFIRVGSFEYFSARGDERAVRQLADYVIALNYPEAREAANPYIALLQAVVERQAGLIAQWMQLGFIHGVMNTDNMSIAGETIDYGPCAFMDAYAHDRVYSYIDRGGRYAFGNQPAIGLWNLTRLAETLLPLLADEMNAAVAVARTVLDRYAERYSQAWLAGMRAKCGLSGVTEATEAEDKALIENLFDIMAANKADFTLTFYYLSRLCRQATAQDEAMRKLFDDAAQLDGWLLKWRARLKLEKNTAEQRDDEQLIDEARQKKMQAVNPVYIPRNHQIEAAIRAAEDQADYSVFHALHEVLQQPFVKQPGKERYMLPPAPHEVVTQTFCGT